MWGMRVGVVCVVVLFLFLPVHAAELSVTATVPLSQQYRSLIQNHTQMSSQRKNWALYISGRVSDGTNPIKNENIDILIVSDEDTIEVKQTQKTLPDGTFSYVFIPDRSRSYTLFLMNTSHGTPFLIGSLSL